MPKIQQDEEEIADESELTEDELEAEEIEQEKPKIERRGRPSISKAPQTSQVTNLPKFMRQPSKPIPKVRRYSAFIQNAREGVIDSESNEVLAETIWEAFAEILERLERLENQIGGMLG